MAPLHLLAPVRSGQREEADDGGLQDLSVSARHEPGVLDWPLEDVAGSSPGVVADLVTLLAVSDTGRVYIKNI